MKRITHNLAQGSEQWHEHRASHLGASDAPAMMGVSKYRSRSDLLREKSTGIAPEVSAAQQTLFDRGHAAEGVIRSVIEKMLSDELYPVTMSIEGDGLPLSASLDGLTLDGITAFECKLWNESLAEQVRAEELEPHYFWQLEQQLLVSGAERVIFATGDGVDRLETMYYYPVPGRAEALIAGWKQFQQEVPAYQPGPTAASIPVGTHIDSLPALHVEVEGKVLATNLDQFRANAMQILGAINRDLKTDQDFADAEQAVKDCKIMEGRLDATKANVLAQMQSVDEVCRAIDSVSAETRKVRMELDRLVKVEKERRRAEIVAAGVAALRAHYNAINATLGAHALTMAQSTGLTIGNAIKGRKTLTSICDAVDTAVAAAKIEASQQAEIVRQNIAILDSIAEHAYLFADQVQLCATKAPDDLRNLAAARIAEHQQREAAGLVTVAPAQSAEYAKPQANRRKATVKLGDINASIAPLSITAAGLATLGFPPVGFGGTAKLYAEDDLQAIYSAMSASINRVAREAIARSA